MTQNSSENFKPFWRLRLGRGSFERPPSNGEGFRDIHDSMSTVLDPGFYIWFVMIVITKCDRCYYKMRQLFYYKMRQVFYYKMRQFYYKMQQLLQIAMILIKNATFITIATVQNWNQFSICWKCQIFYYITQLVDFKKSNLIKWIVQCPLKVN